MTIETHDEFDDEGGPPPNPDIKRIVDMAEQHFLTGEVSREDVGDEVKKLSPDVREEAEVVLNQFYGFLFPDYFTAEVEGS